jgi:hypothetical protein
LQKAEACPSMRQDRRNLFVPGGGGAGRRGGFQRGGEPPRPWLFAHGSDARTYAGILAKRTPYRVVVAMRLNFLNFSA